MRVVPAHPAQATYSAAFRLCRVVFSTLHSHAHPAQIVYI